MTEQMTVKEFQEFRMRSLDSIEFNINDSSLRVHAISACAAFYYNNVELSSNPENLIYEASQMFRVPVDVIRYVLER